MRISTADDGDVPESVRAENRKLISFKLPLAMPLLLIPWMGIHALFRYYLLAAAAADDVIWWRFHIE